MSEIKLYELFKNSIGDKEAETFVYLINEQMEKKFEQWKSELATKDDLYALRIATKEDISALRASTKEDISALRASTKEEMSTLRVEFKKGISELRTATKDDISALRTELLRTIYLTSMGQLLAIVASVISLVMYLRK